MRRVFASRACLLLVLAAACYPGEVVDEGATDVVVSLADPEASFGYSTYAMPDSVVRVSDAGASGAAEPMIDAQILDAVAAELAAVGYTRVQPGAATRPDVVVTLSVATTPVPFGTDEGWWDTWGWYPGWSWWPALGSGSEPGWPVHPVAGALSAGTLLVTMLDPDGGGASATEVPVVWAGIVNRLYDGDATRTVSDFQSLLRTLFANSPWLVAGGSS